MHPKNLHYFEGFFSDGFNLGQSYGNATDEFTIRMYRDFIESFNSYWWTESCILALNRTHAMALLSHMSGKCIVSMIYSFTEETWTDVNHCYLKLSDQLIKRVLIKCASYLDKDANM